jgi:photosystem II stability/assembly factor-like uncharacterized protein
MSTAKKASKVSVLVGTRKGAFILESDQNRQKWNLSEPIFLGHVIHHFIAADDADRTMLVAAKTGHLGPTVFRSSDRGKTWKEASTPPAFPKVEDGGKAVDVVFWLSRGNGQHEWYAGTAPPGLFHSEDDGKTWSAVSGFNEHPSYSDWIAVGGTPNGQFLHSIIVNPKNKSEMYLGISVGGIFHSTDAGKNWAPLNKGIAADFLPDQNAEYGHDPHCMVMHPDKTDRLYHQNHCGIYKIDRPAQEWQRIGANMPKAVGDIGFPIVVHPTDPERVWVFPMDGTEVWPRTSPDGKPSVYTTADGGASWRRQDRGLPAEKAYFTVKRQAMNIDGLDKLGIYFGTTQGEVWGSDDEGESWKLLARHLPEIYSIAVMLD